MWEMKHHLFCTYLHQKFGVHAQNASWPQVQQKLMLTYNKVSSLKVRQHHYPPRTNPLSPYDRPAIVVDHRFLAQGSAGHGGLLIFWVFKVRVAISLSPIQADPSLWFASIRPNIRS